MLIILKGWRKTSSFSKFAHAANIALIAGGIYLFNMQMHGYWHTSDPEAYPMNQDDHTHTHTDMKAEELNSH